MASVADAPPSRDPVDESDYRFHPTGTPCEWGESYHPGGYCPVHIQDIFHDRYRVIRKLGYGSYSTVWLAVDSNTSLKVALKIHTADFDPEHTKTELKIHEILKTDKAYKEHVISLLNSFNHQSPNGNHLCLIYNVLGPNVTTVTRRSPQCQVGEAWDRRLPKQWAKNVLRDTLLGLQLLHRNGIVHGDLQPNNILFTLQPQFCSLSSLEGLIQTPTNVDFLIRIDGKADKWAPEYLLPPQPLWNPLSPEIPTPAKLGDLGGAFISTSPPGILVTPSALRAPEAILDVSFSTAIDMWAFGCLMFELLTDSILFRVESIEGDRHDETTNDEHLLQIIETLQPLPDALFRKWPRSMEYYGPDGKLLDKFANMERSKAISLDGSDGLEQTVDIGMDSIAEADHDNNSLSEVALAFFENRGILEERFKSVKPEDIHDEEEKQIIRVLRLALQTDATARASAAELLEEAWFQS